MDELLTTRQVQDLLQVDRTTVYRMLRDGRLTGVKIGHQWRFSRREVEALGFGAPTVDNEAGVASADVLPMHCIQPIQQVFAEIAQVGAITTAPSGEPLTEMSNACRFCRLVLASDSGRRACVASWRRLARQSERRPAFATCHAGLQYARARIELDGRLEAMLVAGQFYAAAPERDEEAERLRGLAATHDLDRRALTEAARRLPVLDDRRRSQIGGWLVKVARTFEDIGRERADLMGRLQKIAQVSALSGARTIPPDSAASPGNR
jgi:excisionase family DNA binding protein